LGGKVQKQRSNQQHHKSSFSVLSSRNNKREEENKNDVEKDNSSRLITVKTLSMSELMLFLPPDNDSMTNGAVISLLNLHLEKLLACSSDEFKIVLRQDSSIPKILDSYLQYRQRSFDKAVDIQPSREEDDLAKRIFLLLMRISSEKEKAVTKRFFTVPRIIDIATLFAPTNRLLVANLFENVYSVAPEIFTTELNESFQVISNNFTSLVCGDTASSSEVSKEDALRYLRDAARSLVAFVHALPFDDEKRKGRWWDKSFVDSVSRVIDHLNGSNTGDDEMLAKDVSKSFEELRRLVVGDGAINTPPSMSKEAKYVIDEIRSILPDYSEAFLLKCVDVYGLNAERITQHLLEGDVPKELFEEKKKKKEVAQQRPPVPKQQQQQRETKSFLNPKAEGFYVPQPKKFTTEAKNVLDKSTRSNKEAVLRLLENLEYEDEYDDSFDDLPPPPPNAVEKLEDDADPESEEKEFWFFKGRVYNAPKEGAIVIKARSPQEASRIAVAQIDSEKTFGLGEGGNKAVFPRHDASISGEHHLQGGRQQSKKGGGGRGGGGGKASGVSTRGAGSNAPSFQERNRRKAASSRKRDVI
jgi:activating signal cointegrator complex subunit 2